MVILETLVLAPAGMTLNELILETELPRVTVHRLVNSLTRAGLVKANVGRSKNYALGARLLRLLYRGLSPDLVTALARPLLEDLANQFGETILLARLNGSQIEKVAAWAPGGGEYSFIQPGRIMPINAAASAKAIFAFQDKEIIDEVLSEPLVRYTSNTKVSKTAVRAELAQVRRDGFAVCSDEFDPGVLSYACPMHLAGFGTLYSIGIVGLAERMRRFPLEDIVAALQERSEALALALQDRVTGTEAAPADGPPAAAGDGNTRPRAAGSSGTQSLSAARRGGA